jgi:hypothetical protein
VPLRPPFVTRVLYPRRVLEGTQDASYLSLLVDPFREVDCCLFTTFSFESFVNLDACPYCFGLHRLGINELYVEASGALHEIFVEAVYGWLFRIILRHVLVLVLVLSLAEASRCLFSSVYCSALSE